MNETILPSCRMAGIPEDIQNRLPKEQKTYAFLQKHNIPFERVDHSAADTIEQCLAVEKILEAPICKNLFLCNRQKTVFYLLLLPGDKVFHTKELSAQIGSARLSFAGAEDMLACLDITPGSVSVCGLINDTKQQVHLLIDRELLQEEFIGCHPCINTSTLRLRTKDVIEKLIPATGHNITYVTL